MSAKVNSLNRLTEGLEFERLSKHFHHLTGGEAHMFLFPGLKNRNKGGVGSAVVTTSNNEKVVMTYRNSEALAELEAEVLQRLYRAKAHVPELLTLNGKWLVQSFIEGNRLTQEIVGTSKLCQKELIKQSIESLAQIQFIGEKLELNRLTKAIAIGEGWKKTRIDMPKNLGITVDINCPKLDELAINNILSVDPDTFIKWDARSGNAIITDKKDIIWFDWEHCGTRRSLDDLIWFLCDEWLLNDIKFTQDLITQYQSLFKKYKSNIPPERYILVHGTLHMCGRLNKILEFKGSGKWWSRKYCLEFEQMGITRKEALNLINKISDWALQEKLFLPIVGWLSEVNEYVSSLE
jgi:hypothetical protein